MTRIDRHFIGTIFSFFAVLVLMTGIIKNAAMAANDPAFTITGVHVDVTSDNAAKAREEAFAKAQYAAFKQLADRLLPDSEAASFEMPDISTISTLINDFEVTNEQLSTVRYVGTYTFRFKDNEVRKFLNTQNMSYSDVASKPVLVLPFYQIGARTVLWDDTNLWKNAWAQAKTFEGLVPVMVPIGDLDDVSDVDESNPLAYDYEKLQDMIDRYNAREALIVVAEPTNVVNQGGVMVPQNLSITIYQPEEERPRFLRSFKVENKIRNDGGKAMFAEGVQRVRNIFRDQWKSQTVVAPSVTSNVLYARVRFASPQQWIETQSALKNVAGISETKLLSLTPRMAELQIDYKGTEDRLRLTLSQSNFTLSRTYAAYQDQNIQNNRNNGHGGDGWFGGDEYGQDQQYNPNANRIYDLYLDKFRPVR